MNESLDPTKENLNPEEVEIDKALRPLNFNDFNGQKSVIDNLKIFVEAANQRSDALDHTLLHGPPGLGKTTLAHILLGLYQPTSGVLRLDGVAVSPEEMPAWQANCALVPQDIRLLDSSLRENVAFGVSPEHIDDVRVWSALESAQFDESVAEMPHGLYSVIGEDGVKLSGGQRQRLSLARAFSVSYTHLTLPTRSYV